MGEGRTEQRRISRVAAVGIAVAIGAAMAYLGFLLGRIGVYAMTDGQVLIGIGSLVVGAALIGIPLAVLVSQLRSVLRRRG